jgi:sec-independent protein translocase protein TatA
MKILKTSFIIWYLCNNKYTIICRHRRRRVSFIMFIVLMLFLIKFQRWHAPWESDGAIKNATNDIKSEIQKGAEANGLDAKSLSDMTGNINSQISKAKEDLMGDSIDQAQDKGGC